MLHWIQVLKGNCSFYSTEAKQLIIIIINNKREASQVGKRSPSRGWLDNPGYDASTHNIRLMFVQAIHILKLMVRESTFIKQLIR